MLDIVIVKSSGNRVYDTPSAATANFAADVTTFAAAVDLIQVQVTCVDMRTNQEMGTIVTLRSNR